MPKRSRKSAQEAAARHRQEGFRDRGLNYPEWMAEKNQLERELGRPICGFLVRGKPCSFPEGHPQHLHSGDFDQGGAPSGN